MPHARARSGGFGPRGSTRRQTSWNVGPGGVTTTTITASGSAIVGAGLQAAVAGLTLVRLRGSLGLLLAAASSITDGFIGAFGLCKVQVQAFDIGITALPLPIDDMGSEVWWYHRFFTIRSGKTTLATDFGMDIQTDTKSMRKLEDGAILVPVIQVTEFGTADLRVNFDSRVLLKLP